MLALSKRLSETATDTSLAPVALSVSESASDPVGKACRLELTAAVRASASEPLALTETFGATLSDALSASLTDSVNVVPLEAGVYVMTMMPWAPWPKPV